MTTDQFETQRLIILWYISNIGDTIRKKIRLGQDWKNDFFKLYVVCRYSDIFIEYTPQTQAEYDTENINFFTVEEMLEIQEKLNELLITDFALDFIIEV